MTDRLERAAQAWLDSLRRREPPEHPVSRAMEALMGKPSVTDETGQRRLTTLKDDLEHLRLWAVYEAARNHPILEACAVFTVQLNWTEREVAQLVLDIRMGPPVPGQLQWRTSCLMDYRDWLHAHDRDTWMGAAQMAVREWLRETERNVSKELVARWAH